MNSLIPLSLNSLANDDDDDDDDDDDVDGIEEVVEEDDDDDISKSCTSEACTRNGGDSRIPLLLLEIDDCGMIDVADDNVDEATMTSPLPTIAVAALAIANMLSFPPPPPVEKVVTNSSRNEVQMLVSIGLPL
jgi:hypothetical protein